MKTTQKLVLAVFALLAFTVLAIAQTTNVVAGGDGTALPTSIAGYWTLGIAAVTPLIVGGVYKLVPTIPKWLLPTMTPVLGILLGLAINWMAKQNLGWIDMPKRGPWLSLSARCLPTRSQSS